MMTTATPFTALDRCDRCGAQAQVRTRHGSTELLWCRHHFRQHENKLRDVVVAEVVEPSS